MLEAFLNDPLTKAGPEFDHLQPVGDFERTATAIYPNETAWDRSVLFGDGRYDYLAYGNATLRFTREATVLNVTTTTHRITVRRIALSTEAFLRSMERRYGVDLDGDSLSRKQRNALEKAITNGDGYERCVGDEATLPSDFRELMRTIFEGIEGNYDHSYTEGPRLVRYAGERYLTSYRVSVE